MANYRTARLYLITCIHSCHERSIYGLGVFFPVLRLAYNKTYHRLWFWEISTQNIIYKIFHLRFFSALKARWRSGIVCTCKTPEVMGSELATGTVSYVNEMSFSLFHGFNVVWIQSISVYVWRERENVFIVLNMCMYLSVCCWHVGTTWWWIHEVVFVCVRAWMPLWIPHDSLQPTQIKV